jgi:hypothetical protein
MYPARIHKVILVGLIWICALGAVGAETDQFLLWEHELQDCSDALNSFMNTEIHLFLDKINRRKHKIKDPAILVNELYLHPFHGLHSSRVRSFLNQSEDVERYPDHSISAFGHQRKSIFRNLDVFPFILPMARTVRIGDVYLGIDKIGHFFGFGRRFFLHYNKMIAQGVSPEEAEQRVVRKGMFQEASMVGGVTDGIFALADLEANFQGYRLARDLCSKDGIGFDLTGKIWSFRGPINMLDYVTPDFDESYNMSVFSRSRWKRVHPILIDEYCSKYRLPSVQERFEKYRSKYEPSFSSKMLAAHYEKKKKNRRKAQSLDTICVCETVEAE